MSYRSFFLFALLLLSAPVCDAQTKPVKYRGPDFSQQGGPYAVLNNLRFHDTNRVEFVGVEPMAAYGHKFDAAKFIVEAQVLVTNPLWTPPASTEPGVSQEPDKTTEWAEFEVWVGLDQNDAVHDEMLRRIHWYWLSNKPGRWKPLEVDEHLSYKDGKYLMFQTRRGAYLTPLHVRSALWVDGKVMRFELKRFLNLGKGFWARPQPNPDEALNDFIGNRISVQTGGVKMHTRLMSHSFRKEFLKQFEKGTFRGSV